MGEAPGGEWILEWVCGQEPGMDAVNFSDSTGDVIVEKLTKRVLSSPTKAYCCRDEGRHTCLRPRDRTRSRYNFGCCRSTLVIPGRKNCHDRLEQGVFDRGPQSLRPARGMNGGQWRRVSTFATYLS